MKKLIFTSKILPFLFIFSSCEKVIELDLDTQEKELVVDANIDWEKGTEGKIQTINLSYTSPYYYSNQTPEGATGARVSVSDDQGNTFSFPEREQGVYQNRNFSPVLGRKYTLSILYEGKQYESSDIIREVPQLSNSNITQTNNGGFTHDEIILHLRFDANPLEENNFVLRIKASSDGVIRLYGFDGRYFADGHFFTQIVSRISKGDEKFKKGDTVEITLFRVSKRYKDFIRVLSNNSADNAGLFTIPNRVRGNVVNTTDPNKNPLGAFRVAQYSKIVYTIQ